MTARKTATVAATVAPTTETAAPTTARRTRSTKPVATDVAAFVPVALKSLCREFKMSGKRARVVLRRAMRPDAASRGAKWVFNTPDELSVARAALKSAPTT